MSPSPSAFGRLLSILSNPRTAGICLALSGCAAGMVASLAYVPRPYSYILTGLAFLVMLVILGSLVPDNLPTAYSVAVIGFRRSGKTTLLTEIFHELIHFRISDVDASLRGQ